MKKCLLSTMVAGFVIFACQNIYAQSAPINVGTQNLSPSGHIRCGTMENLEMLKKQDSGLEKRMLEMEAETQRYIEQSMKAPTTQQAVIIIPVVFHVVYQNATENISDQRLFDQITVLNKDYSKTNSDTSKVPAVWKNIAANCEIQFCLASKDPSGNPTTGITRTLTTVTSFSTDNKVKNTAQGGENAWDRNKYLNIWVCDLSGGILGYAQFPGQAALTDGVVIHYANTGTTGSTYPYNKGRTATHEIGHWLNLIHIWGDDGGACTGSDQVTDTPNQASANYTCWTAGTVKTDACATTAPGYMWQNYMDYTDDACMYMFTAKQKIRIVAAMNGSSRAGLKTSAAANCAPGTGVNDLSLNEFISVYPNPSTGDIFINVTIPNISVANVIIYNVIGEAVLEKKIVISSSNEVKLDMNSKPDGMYFIKMKTSESAITQKFVINR